MKRQLFASFRRIRWMVFPAIAALMATAGCAGSSSSGLEGPADTIAIFKANCVSCHGSELQGRMGPQTNLQHVGKRLDKEQIRQQIEKGGGGMRAFASVLTDEEIDKVATWLSGKK